MKRLRLLIRAFFGFSRTETNAFVILLPLILVLLFSEPLCRQFYLNPNSNLLNLDQTDSLLETMRNADSVRRRANKPILDTTVLHPFDPNAMTVQQYVSFHLSEKVASRIIRYVEKGGRFHKQDDLLKIYGMDTSWFVQVKKWIAIQPEPPRSKQSVRKVQSKPPLDINLADSIQLLSVYGIGPVLSKRILTFRDRLGGFVSLDQLKEVYGLDTSVVQNLKKRFRIHPDFHPRTIKLNSATLDDLDNHPYISRKEAMAILTYKKQHQSFQSIDQLEEIITLSPTMIQKLRPYLVIE